MNEAELRAALDNLRAQHDTATVSGMGPCACEAHTEARRILAATKDTESEVVTLARQWANCEPGSLPDGIARNRMRRLFGLDE